MTCTLPVAVALSVALVPGLGPLPNQPQNGPAAVSFSVYDQGAIVVPVFIAGGGPYRFLLDTGSTRSAVTSGLALKLGSAVIAQTTVVTPAGSGARNIALVQAVQVGSRPPVSIAAMVLPDEAFPRAGRVDGLLGQDILANRRFTIDYQRRELVWHDAGTGQVPGYRLQLTLVHGLYFVSLPSPSATSGMSRPVRLVADSGADAIVLFASAGSAVRSAATMESGVVRTSAGLRLGRRIWLDELDLGSLVLRNLPALVLPDREATGLLGDGLLPLHVFGRVTFDAAAQSLTVVAR